MNLATVRVLWHRDLVRFFRQKSRVVGALAQPLVFWLVIGGGLDQSFHVPGAEGLGYREYFFPGVVMMVVLFTSIFSTMSVIEDRHAGFLQAVLVAPASRLALVAGKALGGVSVALVQALLVVAVAPWAGLPLGAIDWPLLLGLLAATAFALTAVGFAFAWWLDSTQGYHAVMSLLLIPAWIISGAMFPAAKASPWLAAAMRANPLAYGVEGVRRALYGGALPPGLGLPGSSALLELAVVGGFAAVALAAAAWICARPD